MKYSLWDFTWTHPSQAQIDALTFAKAHPSELPPEEVALNIFTARESEWMRNLKWIVKHPDKIGWIQSMQTELNKLLQEVVITVEMEWWERGGWWAIGYTTRLYIANGLKRYMPVFECIPAHFNMFTIAGLNMVKILLTDEKENTNDKAAGA